MSDNAEKRNLLTNTTNTSDQKFISNPMQAHAEYRQMTASAAKENNVKEAFPFANVVKGFVDKTVEMTKEGIQDLAANVVQKSPRVTKAAEIGASVGHTLPVKGADSLGAKIMAVRESAIINTEKVVSDVIAVNWKLTPLHMAYEQGRKDAQLISKKGIIGAYKDNLEHATKAGMGMISAATHIHGKEVGSGMAMAASMIAFPELRALRNVQVIRKVTEGAELAQVATTAEKDVKIVSSVKEAERALPAEKAGTKVPPMPTQDLPPGSTGWKKTSATPDGVWVKEVAAKDIPHVELDARGIPTEPGWSQTTIKGYEGKVFVKSDGQQLHIIEHGPSNRVFYHMQDNESRFTCQLIDQHGKPMTTHFEIYTNRKLRNELETTTRLAEARQTQLELDAQARNQFIQDQHREALNPQGWIKPRPKK